MRMLQKRERRYVARCADQPGRPVILWSVPASASTEFTKALAYNPRLDVLNEPFGDCYYFGPQRVSERFGDYAGEHRIDRSAVFREVLRSRRCKTCLVKELAFQGRPYVTNAFLGVTRHLFLINRPESVYASLARSKRSFTEDEFGFSAILDIHERVRNLSGSAPWVFTTREFCSNPESVLRDVCALMGAQFDDSMLRWRTESTRGLQALDSNTHALFDMTNVEDCAGFTHDGFASGRNVLAKHRGIVERARDAYETLCTYGYLGGKSAAR